MTESLDEKPEEHGVSAELVAGLSSPVGFVMLNWAFIEQYLASIIESTSDAAAKAGIKVERPRPYAPRLAYVRSLFANIADAQPFQASWQGISDGLDRLEPVRHALSHGTIGAYDADKKVLTFNKVNPDPTKSFHQIEPILISVDNIERAADVSTELATRLGELAAQMMDAFLA